MSAIFTRMSNFVHAQVMFYMHEYFDTQYMHTPYGYISVITSNYNCML